MNGEQKKKKIIIIDDEVSFLNIFKTALESAGFEVDIFSDSQEAVKKVPKDAPDLILLDISMPEMDGLEVLERFKKSFGRHLPKVVFLTNLGGAMAGAEMDEHYAKSVGASGYFKKFEDLDVLVGRIKEVINEV